MKNKSLSFFIVVFIAVLPLLYIIITWKNIPGQIPMHFNAHFRADRIGNKSELWLPAGILAAASVLIYLLFQNIQRFDPKRRGQPVSATFSKLAFVVALFLSAMNFIIILSALKGGTILHRMLFPLLGLFFAFIGNYMNNIKPNYFAGYRLPWTLSDDNNWKRTHHIASKLWFWGGLLIAFVSFFLPDTIMFGVLICFAIIMMLIPVIYSYRMFKNKIS